MPIVPLEEASDYSKLRREAWFDVAWGIEGDLSPLGPPSEPKEWFGGLGDMRARGFLIPVGEKIIAGGIFTDFPFHSDLVSIMTSTDIDGDRMSLDSLRCLLQLPRCTISKFMVRSLAVKGEVAFVQTRGNEPFETASPAAAALYRQLVQHFSPTPVEITTHHGPPSARVPQYARIGENNNGEGYANRIVENSVGWETVRDWDDR